MNQPWFPCQRTGSTADLLFPLNVVLKTDPPPGLEECVGDRQGGLKVWCVGGGLGDFFMISCLFLFPFREWNLNLS